jgi:predicted nucleic acid-binding protein
VTLVDTNILLDLTGQDPAWATWSERALEAAAARGPLLINDVIFAELSVGFDRLEDCTGFLALFLAGKAFRAYRRRGGSRTGVLPDFFIGAHAAVAGLPLLTRDPRRYRGVFPTVRVMSP